MRSLLSPAARACLAPTRAFRLHRAFSSANPNNRRESSPAPSKTFDNYELLKLANLETLQSANRVIKLVLYSGCGLSGFLFYSAVSSFTLGSLLFGGAGVLCVYTSYKLLYQLNRVNSKLLTKVTISPCLEMVELTYTLDGSKTTTTYIKSIKNVLRGFEEIFGTSLEGSDNLENKVKERWRRSKYLQVRDINTNQAILIFSFVPDQLVKASITNPGLLEAVLDGNEEEVKTYKFVPKKDN